LQTFQESGLAFNFEDDWIVIQYDKHRFYRYLSGRGLKGVDFIYVINFEKLVLMEVKNYNDRYEYDEINPTETFLNNLDRFFNAYVGKFNHTLRAIQIIHYYYQRKWWFRNLGVPITKVIPKKYWTKFEWGRWYLMYFLMKKGSVEPVVSIGHDKNIELDKERIKNGFENKMKAMTDFGKVRLDFLN
jgi:hypothetical protein